MSDDVLEVGVVGVGHLGRHHARIYSEMPGTRLVGIVDSDPERARAIAAEYGCEIFASPQALASKVTAASVAVPTEYHLEVAEPLLRDGVDLLIEKPLAPSVEHADHVTRLAAEHSRVLMVGHTERFNPAVMALMRAVDAPRFFEIHRLAGFSARSTDIDVVLDLMIHDLDLVLHMDGSDVVSVDAAGVAALTDKIDIANARIRFASGCVANLTASRISAEPSRRIRIFQARTYLSCDTGAREVDRYRLTLTPEGRPEIKHERLPVEDGEPLRIELEAFVSAVNGRNAPPVDGQQARRAIDLARQVRDSIEASLAGS
jgi:predicted dehydrogenase